MSTHSVDSTTPGGHDDARALMPAGSPVEVRRRFDLQWARGFRVEEIMDHGYVVRRLSDDSILPAVFDADDLRPAGAATRSD